MENKMSSKTSRVEGKAKLLALCILFFLLIFTSSLFTGCGVVARGGGDSYIINVTKEPSLNLSGFKKLGGETAVFLGGGTNGARPTTMYIDPFAMAIYQTTQAEFLAVMGYNPSYFQSGEEAPSRPVERVSWYEAVLYSIRLTLEAVDIDPSVQSYIKNVLFDGSVPMPDGTATPNVLDFAKAIDYLSYALNHKGCYRLPTEAEFEYALRGNANPPTTYVWGEYDDVASANIYGWNAHDASYSTHPVGQKPDVGYKHPYGLYDMFGNVWEWCIDAYILGSGDDMTTKWGSESDTRIMRGGSWGDYPSTSYSSYRYNPSPSGRGAGGGFRLARTVE